MAKETRRIMRGLEREPRVPLSFRVTPEFKDRLDRIAEDSGRSLAAEMEVRLTQSLDGEVQAKFFSAAAHGEWVAWMFEILLKAAANGVRFAEGRRENVAMTGDVLHDAIPFDAMVGALHYVLQAVPPEGAGTTGYGAAGAAAARAVLMSIATEPEADDAGARFARQMRKAVGPDIPARIAAFLDREQDEQVAQFPARDELPIIDD